MAMIEIILSAIFAFVTGIFFTRVSMNNGNDRERCDKIINSIDSIVESFHSRTYSNKKMQIVNGGVFDYKIKSLLDDTTLLPIIGRRAFEEDYIQIISMMYMLSVDSPSDISEDQRTDVTAKMNKNAVDLKKAINCNLKSWRFLNRW